MEYLAQKHPRLHSAYQRLYVESYAPTTLRRDVEERVSDLMDHYGLQERRHDWWQLPQRPQQLTLAGV